MIDPTDDSMLRVAQIRGAVIFLADAATESIADRLERHGELFADDVTALAELGSMVEAMHANEIEAETVDGFDSIFADVFAPAAED